MKRSDRSDRMLRRGFTLIEMYFVVAIIGVLSAILFPTLVGFTSDAKQSACLTTVRTGEDMYHVYRTKGGTYDPAGTGDFQFLIDAGVIGIAPECPSGGTYTWEHRSDGTLRLVCSVHGGD